MTLTFETIAVPVAFLIISLVVFRNSPALAAFRAIIALAILRSIGDYVVINRNFMWNAEGWSALCSLIKQWAGYFLAVAMAGVGLGTDIKKLKQLGAKPFFVGLCAALSVGIISFALIKIFAPFLAAL